MRYKHTLTSASHGDGVAVGTEVVLLAAAVQGALVVGDAVGRTLRALGVSQRCLVEAGPAHWRQRERERGRGERRAERGDAQAQNNTPGSRRLAAMLILKLVDAGEYSKPCDASVLFLSLSSATAVHRS